MDEILAGLNEAQRKAVLHDKGPLLVVAGAGTGKTRVITTRIAHLISSGRAKPHEVMALTFTEKAAREMEQRLYEIIGWRSFEVPVMTFNAFGAELLGRFASHIGRSIRGGLLKDGQKSLLLRQQLPEIELKYYAPQSDWIEFLDGITEYIGRLQNAGVTAQDYDGYVAKLKASSGQMHAKDIEEQEDLAQFYRMYETVKERTGTYDFHDQLALPLRILQQKTNLAERLRAEYKYVLVDEYQDTNAVQDELLRAFVPPDGNIFAVGDDDQAIYGFRGADISNILGFTEHFKTANPAVLAQNYRSGQPILDAAYRLIQQNNPDRLELRLGIDKRLSGVRDEGEVEFRGYATAREEREGVLADIEGRLAAGEEPKSLAVLSTRHAGLAALAKELRFRKIPFSISTAVNIFEQPELINLWFLLRWIAMQIDEEAIAHVSLGPFVGLKALDLRRVQRIMQDRLMSFEEALELDESDAARELVQKLAVWRKWAHNVPVSRLAYRLVFETGMAERWQDEALTSPRMVRVFEDLRRWFSQMQDFESVEINTTVSDYCRLYVRPPQLEATEPIGETEGVQLLTVHAAKGLEFETVFLIGCSRRNWSPARGGSARALPVGLLEEAKLPPGHEFRRLMYVAATRARRSLLVSAPHTTAAGLMEPMSQLVAELLGEQHQFEPPTAAPSGGVGEVISGLRKYFPLASSADIGSKLPFESADGWLELSVTSLALYNFCPFDFYLEHVLKIQQPIGPQLSFGTVLHKIFEVYYKDHLSGSVRGDAEYMTQLYNLWSDRGYQDRRDAERDLALARETVSQWLRREAISSHHVLGSEVTIGLELPEAKLRLRGKIDAMFEDDDGVEIRDFKTGRTKTDNDKLAEAAKVNFQLRSYAVAYEFAHGQPPAKVTLDYVVTGATGSAKLSPLILRNHRQRLTEMAERLRQHDFAPNNSALHTCAAVRYYGTGEAEEWADQAAQKVKGRA